MSKISCDVTKDLLALYLDEMCSEESRELVQEHLKECKKCQEFLEQIKEEDCKTECNSRQVSGLKGLNVYVKGKKRIIAFLSSLIICGVIFALITADVGGIRGYTNLIICLLGAVLMITYSRMFVGGEKKTASHTGKWILTACSFLNTAYMLALQILTMYWIVTGKFPQSIPLDHLGPFVALQIRVGLLIGAVILGTHFAVFHKTKSFSRISSNITWLGMGMGLVLLEMLYRMEEIHVVLNQILLFDFILCVETAVILFLFGSKKHEKFSVFGDGGCLTK